MLENIFKDIESTKKRAKINGMLERLYRSGMTVEDALYNYGVKLPSAKDREMLAYLVLGVRDGSRDPEYLPVDQGKTLKIWTIPGPPAWTCIRIKDKAGWDAAVAYFCRSWSVDTAWGTFRDGISEFGGEDVYLFKRYIDEFTIDSPDSNYDGCRSSHTFLTVARLSAERERCMAYLRSIEGGEAGAWARYLD